MEDSGFDSDPKTSQNGLMENIERSQTNGETSASKMMKKASQLQQKLEKQREAARKSTSAPVLDQPKQKGFLSRNRLIVPNKTNQHAGRGDDTQPLVMIETDESEDEFAVPRLSKQAQMEITQQLIKDGYNLDLEPDDEDLDLIPPRPMSQRFDHEATTKSVMTTIIMHLKILPFHK